MLRTRRTLREALVALLGERGWDDVTVQHVCDRADVGRSTFYLHFADKEDLLISGFDDLQRWLRSEARASATPLGFVPGLVAHAEENTKLFRAVVGKRTGQIVQLRFRKLVSDLIADDLAELAPAGPQRTATMHYLAGAFVEMLIWWIDARSGLTAAELSEHYRRLSAPILNLLRKQSR